MNKYASVAIFLFSVLNLSVSQLYYLGLLKPQSKESINTRFYLHTRADPNNDTNFIVSADDIDGLRASSFDASKKTKFIVHGYYDNGNKDYLKQIVAALLQEGDYNVLRVDWGEGSFPVFDQAFANTKAVGEVIATFINALIDELSFDPDDCDCIGHSMGAYICGFAGQLVNTLGQITALDIGPRERRDIVEWPNSAQLDPSDATFVVSIHTDTSMSSLFPYLGEPQPAGTINYYPNGGYGQPGCEFGLTGILNPNVTPENYADLVAQGVFCSHYRAIYFYIDSILNPSCLYVAYECPSYELFQKGECTTCGADNSKCALLGLRSVEYPDRTLEKRIFYIDTAAESPYCVRHYVVSISTGIISQSESPSDGVITFEVTGDKGSFTDELQVKDSDHGEKIKRLFTTRVDVGQISSVKLTWESDDFLLGLINNYYTLGVNLIEVFPLTHYPESERQKQEVVACLPDDGPPTPIEDGETKSFLVRTDCQM